MKGLSVKKIIIGIILAVVVWLVALFAVRKISYRVIMGEAKDVSDYYEFELDDVEKIVTERYVDGSFMDTQYFYNEDGVCVAKLSIDEDGYCSYAYIYDEYGSLIAYLGYAGGHDFVVQNVYEYEYDDDNNVIREKCYGSDGEPWWYIDYKYDKEGNVKKEAKRSDYLEDMIGAIRYINKYDDGNLVEVKVKGRYDREHTRELEYDRDGNIVSDVYLCDVYLRDVSWGCWECYKEAYEYDDDGNVVKIERHKGDNGRGGMKKFNISYVYDSKGDLVEEYTESETKEAHLYKTYDTEYVGKDATITFEEVEAYEGYTTRFVAVVEFD